MTNEDIAVIFDMDGLLIDSEPVWREAEVEVFNSVGVPLIEEMCHQTTGLRVDEVVKFWYAKYPWFGISHEEVAKDIVSRVVTQLEKIGKEMPGAVEAVRRVKSLGVRLALATSSSMDLVRAVLKRLELMNVFDVVQSAENEEYGKPHPAVYLNTAKELAVEPPRCIAVEDSVRGVISAKAAGMWCIAVPEPENRGDRRFAVADAVLDSLDMMTKEWLTEFFLKTK